ncbi:MAG: EAL domain-containing protein [Cucumibacter sp.]
MRALVYLFVAIVSFSVGAIVYYGLSFTPIEAALLVLIAGLGCWLALELKGRRRAELRLEKAIEDLSRLHTRDSVADQSISAKLDALVARDLGTRTDVLEADVSVLGTVVRQVAETLADLDERFAARRPGPAQSRPAQATAATTEPYPVIPVEMLSQALDENRLIFHMQPILTLPQRRTHGYDLVPRLMLEDGELADSPDYMPRQGGGRLIVRIERLLIETAITIVRRARTSNEPATLFVPLTRASLTDPNARDQLLGVLEANRAVSNFLVLAIDDGEFRALSGPERDAIEAIAGKGVAICIDNARSLRLEIPELARIGVAYIKVEAQRFLAAPQTLTDFHSTDVAAWLARSGISLIARDVKSESQILSLLDDGVKFAEGTHLAPPSPIRADLLAAPGGEEPDAPLFRMSR